jgi:hypothetical protein
MNFSEFFLAIFPGGWALGLTVGRFAIPARRVVVENLVKLLLPFLLVLFGPFQSIIVYGSRLCVLWHF